MSRRMKSKHPRHAHPFGTLVQPFGYMGTRFCHGERGSLINISSAVIIVGYEPAGYSQASFRSNEHRIVVLHEGALYRSYLSYDSASMPIAFNTLAVFDYVMSDVR